MGTRSNRAEFLHSRHPHTNTRRSRPCCTVHPRRLICEPLEDRRLLSVGVSGRVGGDANSTDGYDAFVSELLSALAPTDITLSSSSIAENQTSGTVIGTFSSVDADAGEVFTYTLVSGDGSTDNTSFTIDSSGRLRTAAVLNYEAKSSYDIRVRSTDSSEMWYEKTFTIAVTNVNEQPTNITLSNGGVAENQPSGTTVGTFSTVDPDAGNTFTYTLVTGAGNTGNSSFTIDGTTLKTADVFDYETKNGYSIRVRTTDQDGLWVEKTFTIAITDVHETTPPSVADRVWNDTNSNGIQDSGEPGVPGAVVELYSSTNTTVGDADDVFIGRAITDAGGNYLFGNLSPNVKYYELFRTPVAFTFTTQDAGADDAKDSDVDATGVTALFTLSTGQTDTTRDAGLRGALPGFGFALAPPVSSSNGGRSVATDAAGNVYVTGDFYAGSGDFDAGPGVYNLTGAGVTASFVAKYTPTGALVWARSFGGTVASGDSFSAVLAAGIAVGSDGSTYLTGNFHGTVDFNPGTGTSNLTSAGDYDIFLSKLDSDGNFAWAKRIGASGTDSATDIAVDADGNVCFTGSFNGTPDFDPGTGTRILTSTNGDAFIAKFAPAGTLLWAQQIGGPAADQGKGITVGADGSVYTAGSFRNTVDFDPDSNTVNLISAGSDDGFVVKLSSAGAFVWAKSFGGTGSDIAYDIALDGNGNVYTAGNYRNTVDFNPGAEVFNLVSAGNEDAFILKLTPDGEFVWASSAGGANSDTGYGIAAIAGSVYATGSFRDTADFDPGAGVFNLTSAGEQDAFVLNLNASTGAFGWACRTGNTMSDYPHAAVAAGEGGVYTTGIFSSSVDFDPRGGTFTLSGGAGYPFLAKLLPDHVPTDIALAANSTAENRPIGAVVAALSSTDADAGETFTYSLVSGAGSDNNAAFSVNSSGQLVTAIVFNYEAKASYSIRLRSTDACGMSYEEAFTIAVTDVNEPPTAILTNKTTTLPEDTSTAVRLKVADITITDDTLGTNTVTLSGTDGAMFEIVGGSLYIKAGAVLDFETNPLLSVTVAVDDPSVGMTPDAAPALAITVTNVNEQPTDIAMYNAGLPENRPSGTTVGAFGTIDPDANSTFTYTFVGGDGSTDNASFTLSGNTILTAAAFNYEAKNSYSVRVRSTDAGGLFIEKIFTIAVTDVNEPPTVALTNETTALPEDTSTAARLKVADITVTDDALGRNVLSLSGADAALFEIVGGALYLKAGAVLDFETNPQLDVTVAVNDSAVGTTPDATAALSITVTNVNEQPTDIALSNAGVPEDQPSGTTVGAFSTTDPDAGDTFTYSLVGGEGSTDNASFAISGSTLQTAAVFNYEAKNTYTVRVRSTDAGGLFIEKVCTIAINDVNDPPTVALTNKTTTLPENTSTATRVKVADIAVTDDALGTNVLSLSGADAAIFEIVGGTLYLKAGTVLDLETNPQLDVTVAVDDSAIGATPDATAALSITVTAANEQPTNIALSNASVPENRPSGTSVGVFSTTDPNAGDTFTYTLVGGEGSTDNASFTISGNTIRTAATFNYETKNTYTVRVRSADAGGLFTEKAFTIAVTDVYEPTANSVGNRVWNDLNQNGVQDAGEPGVLGAVVEVYSSANTTIGDDDDAFQGRAITDADGNYTIGGLLPGANYYEIFRTPVGFTFTAQDAGSDDTTDSDADAAGVTAMFTVSGSTTDVTRDAGMLGNFPDFGFAFQVGSEGYGSTETAGGIAKDADGNVYTTGTFCNTVDFDPGPGTCLLASAGNGDVFVAKYSSTGAIVWARSMGGSNSDYARGIAVAEDGSVYTTGDFSGTADFDPSEDVSNLASVGARGSFMSKLDASGNFVWARGLSGTGDVHTSAIAIAGDGSVYTTGSFSGIVDFDPGEDTVPRTSAGGADAFVLKLTKEGGFVWADNFGSDAYDYNHANSLAVDDEGNVCFTGTFQGTADFDPSDGVVELVSARYGDPFVAKLDASGNLTWAVGMGGVGNDGGVSIALADDGSVYTTGYFQGTVDFDPGPNSFDLVGAGEASTFVSKLDSAGHFIWAVGMTGTDSAGSSQSAYAVANAVAVADDGSVCLTGYFGGTVDFDPGPDTFNLACAGGDDIFVSRLNSEGDLLWADRFGSSGVSGSDWGNDLVVADDGSIYLTGDFTGVVDFDSGAGTFNLTRNIGDSDIFVAKLVFGNSAPTDIALSNANVPENQPSGTTVGVFSTTDPNAGDTFTYTLVGGEGSTDNASFTVSGNTIRTAAAFNYEAKNSYSVRVRSTDAGGLFTEKTFTIGVLDVSEQPTDIALSKAYIAENQPSGTPVGVFSTTDPDTGDTFTYTLVGGEGSTDNASFTISGNTLRTAVAFNYEAKNIYTVRVRSTDQGGLFIERTFTIGVVDVAEVLQAIVVSTEGITVPEGGTTQFTVRLAAQPAADVTVVIAKEPGSDPDLTADVTSLLFTPDNWNQPQTVTIAAAQDLDAISGTAGFVLASTGLANKTVTTTEQDDDVHPVEGWVDTVGLYAPTTSKMYLRHTNDTGFADVTFAYGPADTGWKPIAGDWNNDGSGTIGLYNPIASQFCLRNSNDEGLADAPFAYGPGNNAGWLPIVGDWDGNGTDTIGLFDPSVSRFYLRNSNTSGYAELTFDYGPGNHAGWLPIAGDWDGTGSDSVGLFDPVASVIYLRNSNTTGYADLTFCYGPGDNAGWKPITGDWNGDGIDTVGLFEPSASGFYLRNTNTRGFADVTFAYGPGNNAGWLPIANDWNGPVATRPSAALASPVAATAATTAIAPLTDAELQPVVAEAFARLNAAGVSAAALQSLQQTPFEIVDLPNSQVTSTDNDTVYLDRDAAGRGWSLDPKLAEDLDLTELAAAHIQTAGNAGESTRVDLLATVMDEMEHILDAEDLGKPI